MKRIVALLACFVFAVVALPQAYAASDDTEPFKVTTTGIGAKGSFKAIVEAFHAIYRHAYPGTAATVKPSPGAAPTFISRSPPSTTSTASTARRRSSPRCPAARCCTCSR